MSFRGCSPADPLNAPRRRGERGEEGTENESSPRPQRLRGDTSLPNEFTIIQPDWLQLSPYGDFPHARGLQRVNRQSAELMVAQFNSFRGRLGRLFGGLPIYAGHPDMAPASEGADRKAYGWITELEAREDGFYGRAKWSEAGTGLLRNAHYKYLSPYWEAREVPGENGRRIYQPVALISVGLTNQPNIPVKPLANDRNSNCDSAPRDSVLDCASPLALSNASDAPKAPDDSPCPKPGGDRENQASPEIHGTSCTQALAARRSELIRMQNMRDRIQERVLSKMRLGLTYDQAWESVKREHPGWFGE